MSVTMFAGSLLGTILGFATRNRSVPLCKYLFEFHPLLAKSIGLVMVLGLVLIPSFALSGLITISASLFFWGGCFAYSLIVCFALTSCMSGQSLEE